MPAGDFFPHHATWLLLGRARLRQYVDEVAPAQGLRVPLDDLLSAPRRGSPARRDVCAAQAGHENRVRALARQPEVTSDDEASERATPH